MNTPLTEFGNLKFERAKSAYLKFPEVRQYKTALFGAEQVVVSVARLTPKLGEVYFTFLGGSLKDAIQFTFEVSTKDPRRFYGFRCETITVTRRNYLYAGKIETLEKFVKYLSQQKDARKNENSHAPVYCKLDNKKWQ